MRRLIISADDVGADAPRNEGIMEAIRAGIVTSASILANGPALEHAVKEIRLAGCDHVSFGIHLNLSEGRPLAQDLMRLVGPDGNFLGKAGTNRLLANEGDAELEAEIVRESTLQIERLLAAEIDVTHIDGHQHVHIFPAALFAAAHTAKRFGIRRMRIPDEIFPVESDVLAGEIPADAPRFASLGREARKRVGGMGLTAPDHFRGLALKGRLTLERLVKIIETLPGGTTELMVHPGRAAMRDPFSSFSSAERERELDALRDPRFRNALQAAGVQLISFREMEA
jgi:predicted glycoside hydrolase/deacetylase ChbG (UPF0249 family)